MVPIRILFISHDGSIAGAQTTLLTLLEHLDRARFSPHLVVPEEGQVSERAICLGIPVTKRHLLHWLPCVANVRPEQRWRHLRKVLGSLRTRAWAIAQLIEQHQIDVVYTNTVTCVEGAIAARMTGTPHVWHIHEPISGNSELLPLLPQCVYVLGIRQLSARIIFPSHSLASNFPTLRSKASVIHNGLILPAVQDRTASRAEVAMKLGIDPSKGWVAVVGAIQPRKDHSTFLSAAATILKQTSKVHFLIVGSGAEHHTQALLNQVQAMGLAQHVTLTGRWNGPIVTILAAIDVLTISSEQESFGLTAIESMAVETPVVATRCGGPEEIIDSGKDGLLVNLKDSTGMARAILDLLGDPLKRTTFGQVGRAKVTLRFTEKHYVHSIENVLLNACAEATGKPNFDRRIANLSDQEKS